MADFDQLAMIRGPKLSDLAVHVTDVLALNLSADDEFQVSALTLAAYDFVPYALTGLSAAMRTPAPGSVRATTTVTVPLHDDVGGSTSVERQVTLFGPGDVLGVDPGQIVRRYPTPGSTNAEETFHAHIEFDRPELPWAFSAHTPGDRMPPWMTLVVLERGEVSWEPMSAGMLPVLSVDASVLPPLSNAWGWAHAQAVGGTASPQARFSTAYAPVNVSRLLAARVLTQETDYVACLVPTTDVGRNAGLGLGGGTLDAAWTSQSGTVRLPVYDRWEFRTAPDGDFARLARRLVPTAAPWEIGRRFMDASRPGQPFGDLDDGEPGRRQVIPCALFSPAPPPPGAPDERETWNTARIEQLRTALEAPARAEGTAEPGEPSDHDLPRVGPRIYARGQRGIGTIPAGDWFAELNLTPVHRVVAGLGTRVVIKDQEPLMQAAWAQVGKVEAANQALRLAEVGRNLANSLHHRLDAVDHGRLLQMAAPLSARTKLDGVGLTMKGQIARSALPIAAIAGPMRRAMRPTGPLGRRLDTAERAGLTRIVTDGDAVRDFRRPYREPDGIGGLSTAAIDMLDPVALATVVGGSAATAVDTLTRRNASVMGGTTLATVVATPALWREPDVTFRPAERLAEQIGHRLVADVPTEAAADVVLARVRGGLLAGLAVSKVDNDVDATAAALGIAGSLEHFVRTTSGAGAAAVVVTPSVTRSARDVQFRATAAKTAIASTVVGAMGLSDVAAGRVSGTIGRFEAIETPPIGVARPTERERLDRLRTPQGTALASWLDAAASVTVHTIRADIERSIDFGGVLTLPATPVLAPPSVSSADLLARLEPDRTVVESMRARLSLGRLTFDPFAEVIRPIMAAPRFDRPMYEALHAYDEEWLVPGLSTLPSAEMVTLLSANDRFTEAFLVGLSDEMGRELLWRQYPTDTRGTYFHRFWNGHADELTQPIHRFGRRALGRHLTIGSPGESGRAVVVIRGDIVRRYPDFTVMALRQQGVDTQTGFPLLPENPQDGDGAVRTLFMGMLPPDVMLCGLDITVDQLREPGWWIVLSEHPQATRFRRREADLNGHEVRFSTVTRANGAEMAADRLENPVRIAFEATEFLPSVT